MTENPKNTCGCAARDALEAIGWELERASDVRRSRIGIIGNCNLIVQRALSSPCCVAATDQADVEMELRREWWMNHGHDFYALYGDDGEMQCASCPADFKRDPLDRLRELVTAGRLARAALTVSAADQEQVKEAERAFLDASIAVWREIDRLSEEPGGYRGLSQSEALRLRERAAWKRYRDALALLGSQNEKEEQNG